jgi:site-specific recombinase XerD
MADTTGSAEASRPEWFAAFLADRGTRKPSAHTMKAYRQDFDAIATLIAGGDISDLLRMPLGDITTDRMRTAFAQYAETHEAATIQRCWSTWNVLCTFLFTSELIVANPMPLVGRPKLAKTLPKALPSDSVAALLETLSTEPERRRSDWVERDRALILTALLAGLRADELLRANVGDLRRSDGGAIIHIRGKSGKDRRVPIEPLLVGVLEHYLDDRATRYPATAKQRSPGGGLAAWAPTAPAGHLCMGCATRSPPSSPTPISVYTLMKLLGHESMATSQRYVTAAGTETRSAAAQNKLYGLLADNRSVEQA